MTRFKPLLDNGRAVAILTAVVLCLLAVESLGSKKVPPCCSTPLAAARPTLVPSPLAIPPIAMEPNRVLPISPADAETLNDERPLADRPLQSAPPVHMTTEWDKLAVATAKQCLATAVYYEAAGEGWHGELSVAQVVLNRVRHPAYPKTICGVVYQGASLPTGCQFTFTCDGRLSRPPAPSGWKQALAVAEAALSGAVEPRVGMSTHYHTRAVVPYWAGSLDKLAVLGNHIFYTFPGRAGSRAAFNGRIGIDPAKPGSNVPEAALMPHDSSAMTLSAPPHTAPGAVAIAADLHRASRLAADASGTLAMANKSALRPDTAAGRLRSDEIGHLR